MDAKPEIRFPRVAATLVFVLGAAVVATSACASGNAREAAPPPEPAPAPAPPPPPAVAEGIFTDAQAGRGRSTFDEACSDCHTNSEFRGGAFQRNWGRRTVYSFYRTVRSTMPDDNPGGLDEQVYLDVVSYILRMNGHAPGSSELAADSPMRQVRIAPAQGGGLARNSHSFTY